MQIKKDDVKDKKKDSVLTVGMLFSKMKKFFCAVDYCRSCYCLIEFRHKRR